MFASDRWDPEVLRVLPPAGVSVASVESLDDEERQGPVRQIMANHQDLMSEASMSRLGGPAAGPCAFEERAASRVGGLNPGIQTLILSLSIIKERFWNRK